MLKLHEESGLETTTAEIGLIYDKYSAMLLGFISQIVHNPKDAETYLINIFKELVISSSTSLGDANSLTIQSWNDLRKFALQHLPESTELPNHPINNSGSITLNDLQQQVFNLVYYQKQSLSAIAEQLNQPEESIRKSLKEAFAVMKGKREN